MRQKPGRQPRLACAATDFLVGYANVTPHAAAASKAAVLTGTLKLFSAPSFTALT